MKTWRAKYHYVCCFIWRGKSAWKILNIQINSGEELWKGPMDVFIHDTFFCCDSGSILVHLHTVSLIWIHRPIIWLQFNLWKVCKPNTETRKKYCLSDCWCQTGWSEYFTKHWSLETFTHDNVCKPCEWERSGKDGRSWQEGNSKSNDHTLQHLYAEEHRWMHKTWNLEVDGLRQQKMTPSSTVCKTGQNIGRMLPDLKSLDSCCDMQMVGSGFGTNMNTWIHPASYQR